MRIPKLTDLIHSPRFDLDRNRGAERRPTRPRVAVVRRVTDDTAIRRSSHSSSSLRSLTHARRPLVATLKRTIPWRSFPRSSGPFSRYRFSLTPEGSS